MWKSTREFCGGGDNCETWAAIRARIGAMKRFDRAMYAFFLLALLADVARANVPAQVGGESAGGLILSTAGQLRVGPTGGAVQVRRRSNGPFVPIAGAKRCGLMPSRWARILSERTHPSTPVVLTAAAIAPREGSGSSFVSLFLSASPSLTIFEHSGSPAP
jgi:hypothetical protein